VGKRDRSVRRLSCAIRPLAREPWGACGAAARRVGAAGCRGRAVAVTKTYVPLRRAPRSRTLLPKASADAATSAASNATSIHRVSVRTVHDECAWTRTKTASPVLRFTDCGICERIICSTWARASSPLRPPSPTSPFPGPAASEGNGREMHADYGSAAISDCKTS
jgi:hypothetical protein